ncbi:MAG: pyruvate dehydrogenase complex dihydrolipoamide acetyltransferase [Reyranellaceae bacterium]
MTIPILMPALSPTMTEGKLAKWHVKEGDAVKAGQVLCEIETDKATMEVEAVDEGTIGRILIAEGTEGVAVNTPIAVLLEEGEDASAIKDAAPPPAAKPANKPEPKAEAAKPEARSEPAPAPKPPAPQPAAKGDKGGRIFASPLARRLAELGGLDLARITGSGPNGRIVKADVEAAAKGGQAKAAPSPQTAGPRSAAPQFVRSREDTLVPHNNIRKVIARRMTESKQNIPHFYLTVECRIDALLDARRQLNGKSEKIRVSVNDLIIKAAGVALRDYPDVNTSWSDEGMVMHGGVDVSVAVATERGLITPIVKDADMKGLAQISAEMRDLAKRAREGKLKLEEFQGGSMTVSNLGMYGIKEFSAIINPPQSCILAVGAGEQRAIVVKGEVVVANMMSVTLAVDHRVVDGARGAEWLRSFKDYIERPATMLL